MIFKIEDIVFQNDRYFILLNDKDAEKLALISCLDIYADNTKIKRLQGCIVSEILKIPDFTVLESKEDLSELERIFRKIRLVEISTCVKNVNKK
ncbi:MULTISPECIES: hypothetical protein [Chryseobacterium]|uniref:Uncharacterized protein n=1 Tax=Chryseobacterium rhizosphaerae TaxID=395937 RepID=A0AAE3Y7G6_9FLAO|nr:MULTISPECIES: hypothetical protein [Chryseobacterium]MBL3549161.1 hypothetical protein [Chryseobacterium sp. KMC2]MDR6525315.1 hypothetical protein [Chryseobacterium rhizosphaerae]SMC38188.1 hypothetical protein SAMN02787074_0801 [Chryseobacterium sp. YR221]